MGTGTSRRLRPREPKMIRGLRIMAVGLVGLASVSMGQNTTTTGSMSHHAGGHAHDPEMHQAMQKMNRDMMGGPMTGDPDKDFAIMMIPHHQGAIDMARIYLKRGKDEKFRKMAEKIIQDQEREIKEMREHLNTLNQGGKNGAGAAGHGTH